MDAVEKIARTCLYEGYLLWPYRRTALKNTRRWTFGGVYPRGCADALGEPSRTSTQVLLRTGDPDGQGDPDGSDGSGDPGDPGGQGGSGAPARPPAVTVHVRFLQVVDRQVYRSGPHGPEPVDELRVAGHQHVTWQEATERCWMSSPWTPERGGHTARIDIPAGSDEEALVTESGEAAGRLVRSWHRLSGTVTLAAEPVADGVLRLTVAVDNTSPSPLPRPGARGGRDALAPHAFVSTHTVLEADGGAFVSLIDPPEALRAAASGCRQEGAWPVLVSDDPDAARRSPHASPTVLSSPITLYDYPAVAPESPGDLFDGGEIDQLLILSVLSLTPEEQEEARATDPRAREILDRCAALGPDDLSALHGTIRGFRPLVEER